MGACHWDRITCQLRSEGGHIRLLWALFVDSNVKTKIVQHFFFQNPQPLRERDGFFSKLMYFVIYISWRTFQRTISFSLHTLNRSTITAEYRKIPKISPSMYKPPKTATQKTLNPPSKYKPPRGLSFEIALKYIYKVKQSKNGKFTSNYKASPIDFETKISVRR